MTAEQYIKYAETILKGYMPISDEHAIFEIKNNYHEDTISEMREMLMNAPLDLPLNIKEELADQYCNKLIDYYSKFINNINFQ